MDHGIPTTVLLMLTEMRCHISDGPKDPDDYVDEVERDIECRDCGTTQATPELVPRFENDGIIKTCCQCGSTELQMRVYKIPRRMQIELDASIEATEEMARKFK